VTGVEVCVCVRPVDWLAGVISRTMSTGPSKHTYTAPNGSRSHAMACQRSPMTTTTALCVGPSPRLADNCQRWLCIPSPCHLYLACRNLARPTVLPSNANAASCSFQPAHRASGMYVCMYGRTRPGLVCLVFLSLLARPASSEAASVPWPSISRRAKPSVVSGYLPGVR
jgi:hypothetical protein